MPAPRKPETDAAEALIAAAPLASLWIGRLLAGHDPPLTVSQYLALRAIAVERPTAVELARRTGVSGPAVSQLLAGLADAGLLDRQPDPEDRRHHNLTLTPGGARTYCSAYGLLRGRMAALLADLPRPEAEALARALPRVEAALAGAAPPRRPAPPRPPGPKRHPPPPHP
jgi:DNA-binding MarR family transcriptional regulator